LNVWQISQQQMQRTFRLHNLTMSDLFIDNNQGNKQSPMLSALGVLQNPGSEDINLNADQVYNTWKGMMSPQALQSVVIEQCNDIMNIG